MRIYAGRHFGCRVEEFGWRGHRLIVLENETLRVGVVASKGADIVELRYRPRDADLLWHSPHPLLPPAEYVPTTPTPSGGYSGRERVVHFPMQPLSVTPSEARGQYR